MEQSLPTRALASEADCNGSHFMASALIHWHRHLKTGHGCVGNGELGIFGLSMGWIFHVKSRIDARIKPRSRCQYMLSRHSEYPWRHESSSLRP